MSALYFMVDFEWICRPVTAFSIISETVTKHDSYKRREKKTKGRERSGRGSKNERISGSHSGGCCGGSGGGGGGEFGLSNTEALIFLAALSFHQSNPLLPCY